MTTLEDLLALIGPHRTALRAVEDEARLQGERAFRALDTTFLSHLKLVVKNNPSKTATEILARPDVVSALTTAVTSSTRRAQTAIRSSAVAAQRLALQHLGEEFNVYGLPIGDLETEYIDGYVEAVLGDLGRNIETFTNEMINNIHNVWNGPSVASLYEAQGGAINVPVEEAKQRSERIVGVVSRTRRTLELRTSLGVSTTINRAYTDTQQMAYQTLSVEGIEVRKMWVANFVGNTPCKHCRDLHGTIVGLAEEFPHGDGSLRVYGDLQGPGRHPSCRCRLVLMIDQSLTRSNVTPETMTQAARREDRVPQYLSSNDVRQMEESRFASLIAVFASLLNRLKAKFRKRRR